MKRQKQSHESRNKEKKKEQSTSGLHIRDGVDNIRKGKKKKADTKRGPFLVSASMIIPKWGPK